MKRAKVKTSPAVSGITTEQAVVQPLKRKIRRRRKMSRFVKFAFLALAIEVAVALFTSPLFTARKMVVLNAQERDYARLNAVLEPLKTDPLLSINRSEISRQLLNDPRFQSVAVGYGLPFHLNIAINYRPPFAVLTDGRSAYLMDKHLIAYERVAGTEQPKSVTHLPPLDPAQRQNQWLPKLQPTIAPAVVAENSGIDEQNNQADSLADKYNLPVLKISEPVQIELGKAPRHPHVKYGSQVIQLLSEKKLAAQVRVAVDPNGNICLNIGNVAPVKLGNSEQMSTKIATLNEMFRRYPSLSNNVEYFDLSDPSVPVRKIKSGGASAIN